MFLEEVWRACLPAGRRRRANFGDFFSRKNPVPVKEHTKTLDATSMGMPGIDNRPAARMHAENGRKLAKLRPNS